MIDVEFRTKLTEVLPSTHIQQNKVDQSRPMPYVWFRRAGQKSEQFITEERGISDTDFDVECVSTDIDEAMELAGKLKAPATEGGLDNFCGWAGTEFINLMTVEDHADDYEPKSFDADEGLHVAALRVNAMHKPLV